jgi:hypothetical protein
LVACKMVAITAGLVATTSHNWESGKKWSGSFGCATTSYFGATNPYKKFDKA